MLMPEHQPHSNFQNIRAIITGHYPVVPEHRVVDPLKEEMFRKIDRHISSKSQTQRRN